MTIGERIKKIRVFRKMTMDELGGARSEEHTSELQSHSDLDRVRLIGNRLVEQLIADVYKRQTQYSQKV